MSLTINNSLATERCIAMAVGSGRATVNASDTRRALTALQAAAKFGDAFGVEDNSIQNRLENLLTKLRIQAENLQSAKTRILDAQAAATMTSFVCDQILDRPQAPTSALPKLALNLL